MLKKAQKKRASREDGKPQRSNRLKIAITISLYDSLFAPRLNGPSICSPSATKYERCMPAVVFLLLLLFLKVYASNALTYLIVFLPQPQPLLCTKITVQSIVNHVREYILRFCEARVFLPPPPPDAHPFPLSDNKSWRMVHMACDRPGSSYEHGMDRGKLCRLPVSIIIHPPPTTTIIYMSKYCFVRGATVVWLSRCHILHCMSCHSSRTWVTWVVLPVLLIKMINITSDWNQKPKYCELHQVLRVSCGGWAASTAVCVRRWFIANAHDFPLFTI